MYWTQATPRPENTSWGLLDDRSSTLRHSLLRFIIFSYAFPADAGLKIWLELLRLSRRLPAYCKRALVDRGIED